SHTVQVLLAGVQCDVGRCGELVPALKKIVLAEPHNLEARIAYVRALVESGGDASAILAEAVKQAPKDPRVLYWQRRLLQRANDNAQATSFFSQAIEVNPKLIAAYLSLSMAQSSAGKPDEALASLKLAQAQAHDDPLLMVELGHAFVELGKLSEAESRFREA